MMMMPMVMMIAGLYDVWRMEYDDDVDADAGADDDDDYADDEHDDDDGDDRWS